MPLILKIGCKVTKNISYSTTFPHIFFINTCLNQLIDKLWLHLFADHQLFVRFFNKVRESGGKFEVGGRSGVIRHAKQKKRIPCGGMRLRKTLTRPTPKRKDRVGVGLYAPWALETLLTLPLIWQKERKSAINVSN